MLGVSENGVDFVADVIGLLGEVCCPRESVDGMMVSPLALCIGMVLSSVVCSEDMAGILYRFRDYGARLGWGIRVSGKWSRHIAGSERAGWYTSGCWIDCGLYLSLQ